MIGGPVLAGDWRRDDFEIAQHLIVRPRHTTHEKIKIRSIGRQLEVNPKWPVGAIADAELRKHDGDIVKWRFAAIEPGEVGGRGRGSCRDGDRLRYFFEVGMEEIGVGRTRQGAHSLE